MFCPNLSVGVGEHVWPAWFIAEFGGQGPFTTTRGGVPYTKRDGKTPLAADALSGVHVPACKKCNAEMNTCIEVPAKPVVRRLLAHGESHDELILSADDCAALARWLIKVGLLSAHPAAEHDHPGLQRDTNVPRLTRMRPEWLGWMRTGSPPPEGFSVFVSRRHLSGVDPAVENPGRIILPQVVVDGENRDFMSRSFGFMGTNATIVWHPGWPIQHPQVDKARAVRLWPAPSFVDFGAVPQSSPRETSFVDGSIASIRVTTDEFERLAQQPLGLDFDPTQAFFASATWRR